MSIVLAGDIRALAMVLDNLLQLTPQPLRERGKMGRDAVWRFFNIRQAMPKGMLCTMLLCTMQQSRGPLMVTGPISHATLRLSSTRA